MSMRRIQRRWRCETSQTNNHAHATHSRSDTWCDDRICEFHSRPLLFYVAENCFKDVIFERRNINDWNKVVKPRAQGAWNLHNQLSKANLEFFIMLVSNAGIAGNRGQPAYNASNTFMDTFSYYRAALGLPASTIDVGMVADVGYFAESDRPELQTLMQDFIQESELYALVKSAIGHRSDTVDYRQTVTGLRVFEGRPLQWWAADRILSHILRSAQSTSPGE